jgi:hypothetical protein
LGLGGGDDQPKGNEVTFTVTFNDGTWQTDTGPVTTLNVVMKQGGAVPLPVNLRAYSASGRTRQRTIGEAITASPVVNGDTVGYAQWELDQGWQAGPDGVTFRDFAFPGLTGDANIQAFTVPFAGRCLNCGERTAATTAEEGTGMRPVS